MIVQLKGRIVVQDLSYLVLDVGGIGYQVFASGRACPSWVVSGQR